ncbi:hypothetical protein ASD64_07200 [Mesorhizobium sp. Root157]|nr:hypothetical protein ASD64_07200 [Mesorhizobium sp. Root157]
MVAYSFKAMFSPQIIAGSKLQTVRADRKRHARPGEPVQLYQGMRTRHCRKLVDPDPICTATRRIEIATTVLIDDMIATILIDGIPLRPAEIEAFACADGFGVDAVGDWRWKHTGWRGSARWNMGHFWMTNHGAGRFDGVLIEWRPA